MPHKYSFEDIARARLACSSNCGCDNCVLKDECRSGNLNLAGELNGWLKDILHRLEESDRTAVELTAEDWYNIVS